MHDARSVRFLAVGALSRKVSVGQRARLVFPTSKFNTTSSSERRADEMLSRSNGLAFVASVARVASAADRAFHRHAAELHVLDDRETGRKRDVTPCAFSTR